MPVLLGMILGITLIIAAAFAYDTTTGRAPNGILHWLIGMSYAIIGKT
jgi:hypothetical protein